MIQRDVLLFALLRGFGRSLQFQRRKRCPSSGSFDFGLSWDKVALKHFQSNVNRLERIKPCGEAATLTACTPLECVMAAAMRSLLQIGTILSQGRRPQEIA